MVGSVLYKELLARSLVVITGEVEVSLDLFLGLQVGKFEQMALIVQYGFDVGRFRQPHDPVLDRSRNLPADFLRPLGWVLVPITQRVNRISSSRQASDSGAWSPLSASADAAIEAQHFSIDHCPHHRASCVGIAMRQDESAALDLHVERSGMLMLQLHLHPAIGERA